MTYYVCKPEIFEQFRRDIPELKQEGDGLGVFPELELFSKSGQKGDVWAFKNLTLLRSYLNGDISEEALISLSQVN